MGQLKVESMHRSPFVQRDETLSSFLAHLNLLVNPLPPSLIHIGKKAGKDGLITSGSQQNARKRDRC